ncbi:MAG: FtsW/RodA/SpoVE family cell cycle protein [Dysgonomonas sp.]|uniref:FtsW/RodA/SpoVE family cell cycle protein n=1 Tax=Dysgonomonas sp. TaxID=1891233 RepID=UPI0039E5A266
MNIFERIFKGDKTIWCIFIALCIISLLEVFSASSTIVYRQHNHWGPIFRHAVFLMIGFGAVVFLQRVPTRYFSGMILLVPLSWVLLIMTMFLGSDVNGAQRWLGVGGVFTIQPSEIAKLALMGYVAFFLSKLKDNNQSQVFKFLLVGIGITCALIITENLSTACLLLFVCYLMMFIGQVDLKKLGLIALVGIVSIILLVGMLTLIPASTAKAYLPDRFATWQARIDRHSSAEEEGAENGGEYKITDENYQVSHAKIAIANGKIIGLPGSGTERDFLPQAYSDFIFAIILEEMGLLGGLFTLLLYVALMIRAGILASKCEKLFPRYLLLGAALLITIQALANMAVAVNLIPVTGQPLPLISRGGTSTIITCVYFGIILACSNAKEDEHEDVDESIANVDYE